MYRTVRRIIIALLLIEAVLFVAMILTSMTDSKPLIIDQYFYWALKYVFGFPLVLIDPDYPFFLNSQTFPVTAIFMVILNNLILAIGIYGISQFVSLKKEKA
jgi:hypothetical protein